MMQFTIFPSQPLACFLHATECKCCWCVLSFDIESLVHCCVLNVRHKLTVIDIIAFAGSSPAIYRRQPTFHATHQPTQLCLVCILISQMRLAEAQW